MSGKTEMAFDRVDAGCQAYAGFSDESCLDVMRGIVKEYIVYRQEHETETDIRQSFKNRYDEYRQKMHDDALRAYTAFDFMEKLYWQEYLIKG